MKAFIERAKLLRLLQHAQAVVERRNTIPILSNVLIKASDGRVSLAATDLDILSQESTEANVVTEGVTTVPAHTLFDIIRKMPEGAEICLDAAESRMIISAGRARFQLNTLPATDFPLLDAGELPHSFKIEATELSRLLRRTKFAMSTEETRYYLNGIFLHIFPVDDKIELRAVSTDGHRLSLAKTNPPAGADPDMPRVIIPRKCVNELTKVIDEVEGDVTIALSAKKIRIDMGGLVFISKTVDGTFPEYMRVIPQANPHTLTINAHDLILGLERVSVVSSEKTRAVKVELSTGKVVLSVTSPEHGTATEEIEADYRGTPLTIGFNSRYLIEVLSQHQNEDVVVHLNDPASPALFTHPSLDTGSTTLMPMRT